MALKKRVVKRFRAPAALARFAAGLLTRALRGKKGPLLVAVPGGRTPLPLFEALAAARTDWARVHFFMADERLVPANSPASNFGQARKLLFSKIAIPPRNLHAVKPGPPRLAAAAYGRELSALAGRAGGPDLVFLGLGEDGHIASLFPGSAALRAAAGLILPARAPAGVKPASRITLSLAALNAAPTVALMAIGRAKKAVFARAAAGDPELPAGRLSPRGALYLLYSDERPARPSNGRKRGKTAGKNAGG